MNSDVMGAAGRAEPQGSVMAGNLTAKASSVETSPVAIIGAGGHARVVASTLRACGRTVAAFYDDDNSTWGKTFCGVSVAGPISAIANSGITHAIIGIGDNAARKRVADQLGLEWVTVVHPFSWVHPDVALGPGTLVCAGAVVQPGAKVGAHVLLNTKASVDHDTCVGDFVHIAVAHLAGGASADDGAFLALGSTVLPGVHVGAWATVGAGSVVTKNVRPGVTVVGVPARELH